MEVEEIEIHGNTFHCNHSRINATCYFELKILSLQVQDSYIRLSNNRDLFEMLFGTKSSHDISIYSHLLNIWNTPNKVHDYHSIFLL